jgi:MOSC domain-containing protein YiiM
MSRTAPGKAGRIVSLNISRKKGQVKTPVPEAEVIGGEGMSSDAHRAFGHRQVSLLMLEMIEEQAARIGDKGTIPIGPGAFAENLTTEGIELRGCRVGDELVVGESGVRLKITQIGKECHTKCAVFKLVGDCIMPELGVFCEVLEGGTVKVGDTIEKR